MPITYQITATPAQGTITGYKLEGTTGAEAFRLKPGPPAESAVGQIKHDNLLFCFTKGVWGWVDVRRGKLTESGAVDPPPVDPPPVIPSTFSVTVGIGPMLGITNIDITGDETQPFTINLNQRTIWP